MIQENLVIQTRFIAEFDKDEFVGEPVEFRAPSCPGHVRGQSPRQTSSWLDSNSISTVSVMKIIVRDYWHRKGGSCHRKKHMFDPRHRFSREGAHGVDKHDDRRAGRARQGDEFADLLREHNKKYNDQGLEEDWLPQALAAHPPQVPQRPSRHAPGVLSKNCQFISNLDPQSTTYIVHSRSFTARYLYVQHVPSYEAFLITSKLSPGPGWSKS